MKKIFTACALAATMLTAGAVDKVDVKIWSVPYVYLPDEEVKWYFDLTPIMETEGEPFYMHTWAPSNPEKIRGNTDYKENPSERSTLIYEGNGVYSKTLQPTEHYIKTFDELMGALDIFWLQIRCGARNAEFHYTTLTNSQQAPRPFHVEYPQFIASKAQVKIYPEKFTYKDNISILVNLDELVMNDMKGSITGDNAELYISAGPNNFDESHSVYYTPGDAASAAKTKLKHMNGNIYKFDMKPADFFGITDEEAAEGWKMSDIALYISTADGSSRSAEIRTYAADVEPDPDPVFSYFPRRMSQLDFLTLTRANDDKTANLQYTITGGTKSITGEFGGSRAKRTATIDLFSEFQGQTVNSIHVLVTRNGATVEELDINLVAVSDID